MKDYLSQDKITFGKYKGKTIDYVVQFDPEYIDWMNNTGLCSKNTVDKKNRGEYKKIKIKNGYSWVWYYK